jgi:diguanylate cyclase (GGDEF)-like protein
MSFMMLDVDHFKSYNDQFGHPAGDEALKLVGHVIRETLRGADVAARFGGEEFAILLPQTSGEEAIAIAERIRQHHQAGANHVCLQVLDPDFRGLPLPQWRRLATIISAL